MTEKNGTGLMVIQTDVEKRSFVVAQTILAIKGDLMKKSLEMGRLLVEARDGNYNLDFGFVKFGAWVESEQGLDVGERTAYYLMRIVEMAKALGISDEKLENVKLSKLKEIFSLKAGNDEVIKELVDKAATATLDEIRDDVRMVKIADGAEAYVYMTMKMPLTVKEKTVEPAHERARKEFGNTINSEGDVSDIPDWRCMELIYGDYLATGEEDTSPVIEGEFEDSVEIQEGTVEG